MFKILKYVFLDIILLTCVLYADFPNPPDFSLDSKSLKEPQMLTRNYIPFMPDSWEYYKNIEKKTQEVIPNAAMIMEICVVYDTTKYIYRTKEELMFGCNRGDIGLLHLVIQPYQYMSKLHSLQMANLVPDYTQKSIIPKVVIYYKNNETTNCVVTSIEFGDLRNDDVFFINGQAFKYNREIMTEFSNFIYEISDTTYLPETTTNLFY